MSFTGNFELVEADKNNFLEYMKVIGVSMFNRNIGVHLNPKVEITLGGDEYTIKTTSTIKTHKISFKLDTEFDEEMLDGRKAKSTVRQEGNKLVNTQNLDGMMLQTTREFTDTQMTLTLEAPNVKCVRLYKRV